MTTIPATTTSGRRRSGADRGPLLSTAFVLDHRAIIAGGSADSYFGGVVILALTYAIVTAGMAVQIGFSQQVVFSQSVFMGLRRLRCRGAERKRGLAEPARACRHHDRQRRRCLGDRQGRLRASGLALAVATLMFPLIAFGYVSYANWLGGSIGLCSPARCGPAGPPLPTESSLSSSSRP